MNEELVSVVVPVYNVEAYLPRCLERLIRQTYQNLEILLVDDGSQDSSGEICEQYAAKDSRILVFHKENGGLADARNYGLKQISGQYVTFVDSDDYVAEDYVAYLYDLLKQEQAEVSVCQYRETSQADQSAFGSDTSTVMDGKTAVKNMFYQRGLTTSACAKLYKTSLFQQIQFPPGRLYEDVNTIYQVLLRADRVVCSEKVEYFYFMRPKSIVHSGFQIKKMDYIFNMQEVLEDIRTHTPELLSAAISRFLWANLHILVQMPRDGYPEERKLIWKNMALYRGQVLRDPQVRLQNKLLLLLSGHNGRLVRWIYRKRRKSV